MYENRLTFVRFSHFVEYKHKGKFVQKIPHDVYQCSCGNQKTIERYKVKNGRTRSCGCLAKEVHSKRMKSEEMVKHRRVGGNEGNKYGAGPKKGNVPFNKGKVFMPDRPGRFGSTGYYVTPERADAIHYGLDGEVHSARVKVAHNKGKKFKDGKYI